MESNFELKSGKQGIINLFEKTKSNKIEISNVRFNTKVPMEQSLTIIIVTKYPNGKTMTDNFLPIEFKSVHAKNEITDIPFKKTIDDCKYTTLELEVTPGLVNEVSYTIIYKTI